MQKEMENKMMGYNVFKSDLDELKIEDNKKKIINTINAYSYVIAKTDEVFQRALITSDILLPDGFPIAIGFRLLYGEKISKIAGEDIFYYLMEKANKEKKKVFFLGSSDNVLQKILNKVNVQYPNVKVGFHSPPYKPIFQEEDDFNMLKSISEFAPDILFVGMTAPKQEKWVADNHQRIAANVICSIGAVFDFYAGTVKRPSSFWIKLNLEWFIRFVKEPKRLWKRYFIYSPVYCIDLFKEYFNVKVNKSFFK